jgi:hypothetical protein
MEGVSLRCSLLLISADFGTLFLGRHVTAFGPNSASAADRGFLARIHSTYIRSIHQTSKIATMPPAM